jgi:hypothetical protein
MKFHDSATFTCHVLTRYGESVHAAQRVGISEEMRMRWYS